VYETRHLLLVDLADVADVRADALLAVGAAAPSRATFWRRVAQVVGLPLELDGELAMPPPVRPPIMDSSGVSFGVSANSSPW
jgi:hypothetical protein